MAPFNRNCCGCTVGLVQIRIWNSWWSECKHCVFPGSQWHGEGLISCSFTSLHCILTGICLGQWIFVRTVLVNRRRGWLLHLWLSWILRSFQMSNGMSFSSSYLTHGTGVRRTITITLSCSCRRSIRFKELFGSLWRRRWWSFNCKSRYQVLIVE